MTIISKLRSLLGLDGEAPGQGGTTVRVEREPVASDERAVEEAVPSGPDASDEHAVEEAVPSEPDASNERAVKEAVPSEPDEVPGGSGEPVDTLSGIGPAYADRLSDAGIETVGDLAAADPAALDEATDLGEGRLAGWIERARDA